MNKQKQRSEIDEKYKWDLTTIYKSDDDFLLELENVKKEIDKIEDYKGKILSNADTLLNFLKLEDDIDRKINKLYNYAHLHNDEDTTNVVYQNLKGMMDNLLVFYSEKTSFVNPEMYKQPYSLIEKYYLDNKELCKYKFNLECFYRYENHKLTEEEEKILSTLSNVLSLSENAYESLTDSDLKFGYIENENNEKIELTESNYPVFMKSISRSVRKNAFDRMYETYAGYKNTITTTFKGNVDYLCALAKIENFNSSLEASLYEDNICVDVYNNLIDTVNNNLDVLYKYYDLKKEVLNLDELHMYDMYVELINDTDKQYSFEDAKKIVIDALSILGEDYVKNLNRAFSEKWIDVYNNVGKRTGAYSSGSYDTNPFVLLNFEGKLNDVSTLAHELGHSMHTYYSCKNNPYNTYSYKIFVAEVASTVNELLLNKYLLENSKDDKEKLFILNNLMELFKSTIYRQTMFAEFERDMHKKTESGDILTNDLLSEEYYKLNKKYYGDNVVVDDLIKYEWERIPHFYYDFYVYKYAIGLSSACYIVNNILSGKKGAVESYLKFLSSGGSDYPANELKIAGVDINSSEVIQSAIDMFNETIDEFKSIYSNIK